VEEVAPRELAHERRGTGDLSGPAYGFLGRDAPEVEVRGQTRRRVCFEIVVAGLVAGAAAAQPGGEPLPSCGLATPRTLGREAAGDEPAAGAKPAPRNACRHRQATRDRLDRATRRERPCPVERREHAVVTTGAGREREERRDGDTGSEAQADAVAATGVLEGPLTGPTSLSSPASTSSAHSAPRSASTATSLIEASKPPPRSSSRVLDVRVPDTAQRERRRLQSSAS
jgi:hypothetical protein